MCLLTNLIYINLFCGCGVEELSQYITDVQKLKANDKIKYSVFKSLLVKLYKQQTFPDDYKYDWVIEYQEQNLQYIRGLTMKKEGASSSGVQGVLAGVGGGAGTNYIQIASGAGNPNSQSGAFRLPNANLPHGSNP